MTHAANEVWPTPTGPPVAKIPDVDLGAPAAPGAHTDPPVAPTATAWTPTPPPTRPGRRGYVIGALIIGIGSFLAIALFGLLIVLEPVPDFPAVAVPGEREVTLEAQRYLLFDERPTDEPLGRPPTVRITGPNGDEPILPTEWSDSYVVEDRTGTSFASIRPAVSGTYRVQVTAEPSVSGSSAARVTIGEPTEMGGYMAAMLLGFVTFLVGLAVIVATAFARLRHARQPRPV